MISMLRLISGFALRVRWIETCFVPVLLCAVFVLALPHGVTAAENSHGTAGFSEAKGLAGSWLRLDGGYVLELRNFADDGTLAATYYNPRKINVSRAFWVADEGTVALFVELQDINYPGSKYSLHHDPAADRLKGFYYQAVQQQTYSVEFIRKR